MTLCDLTIGFNTCRKQKPHNTPLPNLSVEACQSNMAFCHIEINNHLSQDPLSLSYRRPNIPHLWKINRITVPCSNFCLFIELHLEQANSLLSVGKISPRMESSDVILL